MERYLNRLILDKGMLHIHQALEEVEKKHRTDRRFRLGDTKNEESERYAPAIQEVFACFKELEEIQVENGWRDNEIGRASCRERV